MRIDATQLPDILWMLDSGSEPESRAVDEELVLLLRQACDGDLGAFEQILKRSERQVFLTARRILGNTEDAQDAAQEVFIRTYRFLNRLKDARQFQSWLFRMTVNVCNDLLSKRQTVKESPLEQIELPPAPGNPETTVSADERQRFVYEALARLPQKERAAIVLRDIQGLDTREVAAILGSSETTVRSQISSARIRLRKLLSKTIGRHV